jgi:hypothetical protein
VLNDAHTQSHHTPQTIELLVASHTTNTVFGANYESIEPQNGPTPHEHVIKGPHVAMGMVIPILTHLSTSIIKNYLPIRTISPCGQFDPAPLMSIPLELHLLVNMP